MKTRLGAILALLLPISLVLPPLYAFAQTPEFVLSHEAIDFGEVALHTESAAVITVENTGDVAPLVIAEIYVSQEDPFYLQTYVPEEGIALDHGDAYDVAVGFSPMALGLSGPVDVYFVVHDPSYAVMQVSLTGSGVPALPPPPDMRIGEVITQVNNLVGQGLLNSADADVLTADLEAARLHYDSGNTEEAVGMLGAFSNQVRAYFNEGRLPVEEGRVLIRASHAVIDVIEAESMSD